MSDIPGIHSVHNKYVTEEKVHGWEEGFSYSLPCKTVFFSMLHAYPVLHPLPYGSEGGTAGPKDGVLRVSYFVLGQVRVKCWLCPCPKAAPQDVGTHTCLRFSLLAFLLSQ